MLASGHNEQEKLKGLIKSVLQASREREQLGQDITDYLAAIKEEFEIKPAKVRKAVKAIMKGNIAELKKELEDVEELVDLEGKIPGKPTQD
jgi:hypothetical protein